MVIEEIQHRFRARFSFHAENAEVEQIVAHKEVWRIAKQLQIK